MIVGILFLEETHEDKKDRRDIGLEAGDWILSFFHSSPKSEKGSFGEESLTLLVDSPPGYLSQESSPALTPVTVGDLPLRMQNSIRQASQQLKPREPTMNPFTRQVVLNIISYGVLA